MVDVLPLLGNQAFPEAAKLHAAAVVDFNEKAASSDEIPAPDSIPAMVPSPPCGAITEISGALSSGRTTLTHAILARATAAGEFCAFVDGSSAFDPWSAVRAGVDLPHLLWVRANGRLEAAMKAADLILHSGGFGVIVLDLCEASARDLNRIPLSYWYRFRRAVENTPGKLVVVSHVPLVKSCARLRLETQRESVSWTGSTPLFGGIEFGVQGREQPAIKQLARLAG
jgi:hypothetical protein